MTRDGGQRRDPAQPAEARGENRRGPRLIALAALGFLLFNFPLLALFERGALFGLPLPVVWLFGVWALLIALAALLLERDGDGDGDGAQRTLPDARIKPGGAGAHDSDVRHGDGGDDAPGGGGR